MDAAATVSGRLASFVHGTSFADLPVAVREMAKLRMLDAIATAIESRALPVPAAAMSLAGSGRGACTVIGHEARLGAIDAAFVNATLVNGSTHDDFLRKSHPGAASIPAALAVAEEQGASGADVLAAVVLGYDVVARAYLGGPAMLPRFRASGVAGAVGAAATAARLACQSPLEVQHALGLGAMFASGFGEGFLTGAMDVKLNVGWACRSGVSAAVLARHGATAAPTAFEGRSGFFEAFAGSAAQAAEAVRDLGAPFLIEQVVYKERPVCIFVQTPVQLACDAVQRHGVAPARIERVTICAPQASFTNPGFQNEAPYATPLQARISARFCTAAALLGKPIDDHAFYARTSDPEVLALAQRIELGPPVRGNLDRVRLEIVQDGRVIALEGVEMDTLRPSRSLIVAKFRRLAADHLGARTEAVLERVLQLEQVPHVGELTRLLGGAAA